MAGGAEPTFRRRLAAAAAGLALLGSGCKSGDSFRERMNAFRAAVTDGGYDDPTAAEKLSEAERQFADRQYAKAQDGFGRLADNRANTQDLAERARFMKAECLFMREQYPDAVDAYHRLLLDFPTGAHRRDACGRIFEVCDYWLNDFRAECERRADEPGIQRWRPAWKNPFDQSRPLFGQEGRTLDALEHVWTHDLTGPVADKALFWCGYVNFVRGNFEDADHFFSTLAEMHKDSPLRPQAVSYAILAKNNATGGPDYDARKCAEALQLVSQAEAGIPELTQNPEMADKLTRAKFAIRYQQAEKDFRVADYYERTGHPGSAVFCYELVRRRYAGTKYADQAEQRKERLLALMREGKPAPGTDPFAVVGAKWREVFGTPRPAAGDPAPADPKVTPAGGPPPGP
jgi:outer membrane protein assembly factor BamD (BamD/ComL family)